MTYNFQNRLDLLGPRRKAIDSEVVTWEREGFDPIEISVSFCALDNQEFMPGINITQTKFQDVYLDSIDLVFGGDQSVPYRNDKVTRGNGEVYRTVSETGGRYNSQEAVFIYSTPSRKRMRVHLVQSQ